MSFIYYCPHCQDAIECPDGVAGQNCQCPTCQRAIIPQKNFSLSEKRKRQRQYNAPFFVILFEASAIITVMAGVFGALVFYDETENTAMAVSIFFYSIGAAISLWVISLFVDLLAKNNFYLQKIVDRLEE